MSSKVARFLLLSVLFLAAICRCMGSKMLWTAEGSGSSDSVDDGSGASGALDNGFGTGGFRLISISGVDIYATSIVIQSDGKILIGGYTSKATGTFDDFLVIRLSSDGSLDESFGTGGIVTIDLHFIFSGTFGHVSERAYSLALDSDQRIYVAGYVETGTSAGANFGIAKLNSDGRLASYASTGVNEIDFGTGLSNERDHAFAMGLVSGTQALIVGETVYSTFYDLGLTRLLTSGLGDSSFGNIGGGRSAISIRGSNERETALAVDTQADGKIVLAVTATRNGNSSLTQPVVVRVVANGNSTDSSYAGGSGYRELAFASSAGNEGANAVKVDGSGRIVIAGFSFLAGRKGFGLARTSANGLIDSGFSDGGAASFSVSSGDDIVRGMAIDSKGRIVVAGSCDNELSVCLARVDSNGELDSSWGSGGKRIKSFGPGSDYATALALQADDSPVVVGNYSDGMTGQILIARFLP